MSQFKATNPIGHGARKGAFAVPKQLAFQKVFGNGCAVDGDKIATTSVRLVVQRTRYQLLARATFSGNQHGSCGRCHTFN